MRRSAQLALAATLVTLPPITSPALAGAWGSTQHGGRATGQAGAFVARASDPSAVTYNPAGVAHLPGLQLQAGLDFSNATDDYSSVSGDHSANHTIQFPPALYATYRPAGAESRWAVGLGVDTPTWYSVDWDTALFPARFLTRETTLRLWQVHPVAAYAIDERWSVGGGVRYVFGDLELGQNVAGALGEVPGRRPEVPFEAELTADGSVDAVTFDLGVQYATNVWGWGAVYRHGADLDSDDPYEVSVRDITIPELSDVVERNLGGLQAEQSFELPREVAAGVWLAPYPELRLELDLVWASWSRSETRIVDPVRRGPVLGEVLQTRTRDWDDTLSARLGVEGDVTSRLALHGGLAWEPSPVPSDNVEPGFPRGDALVYSVGFSYDFPQVSFDVGYSFWDHDDRRVTGQEIGGPDPAPDVLSTYTADEQVWSASARWRF